MIQNLESFREQLKESGFRLNSNMVNEFLHVYENTQWIKLSKEEEEEEQLIEYKDSKTAAIVRLLRISSVIRKNILFDKSVLNGLQQRSHK